MLNYCYVPSDRSDIREDIATNANVLFTVDKFQDTFPPHQSCKLNSGDMAGDLVTFVLVTWLSMICASRRNVHLDKTVHYMKNCNYLITPSFSKTHLPCFVNLTDVNTVIVK